MIQNFKSGFVTIIGRPNVGKSTLMKCMFGIYHMDEGEVIYEGEKVQINGPLDALNRGIAMVHQELQPIPERSIGENIFVGTGGAESAVNLHPSPGGSILGG